MKKIYSLFVLPVALTLGIGATKLANQTVEIPDNEVISTNYEFPDDSSTYEKSDEFITTEMSYGKEKMSHITVTGNISQISTFKGVKAFGANNSENLSFNYSFDKTLLPTDVKEDWHLANEDDTSVNGKELGASIGYGAIILEKSVDNYTWEDCVNPLVNNNEDRPEFYTTAGEDIKEGMFYRITVAYETERKIGTSGVWPFQKDKMEYKKHLEEYKFYICDDTLQFSLHNLDNSKDDIINSGEGFDSEVVLNGETLLDGSITKTGFKIDLLGNNYLTQVSYNDGEYNRVYDKEEITEPGKYNVRVISKLGSKKVITVYIFNEDDNGFSTYFGTNPISGKRVYENKEYPSYELNSKFNTKNFSEFVPSLSGTIRNVDTNKELQINAEDCRNKSYVLDEGQYNVEILNGNPNAGRLIKNTFNFYITSTKSEPRINYNNLMNRIELKDMKSKHYEVSYLMTKGGQIYVCFALESYQEALDYAYEIEGRFIKKVPNEEAWMYINPVNNHESKYLNAIDLTAERNRRAKRNVVEAYFNPLDEFTYRTLKNDEITNLENLNLSDSIHVFPSLEEKNKMVNRLPYLNDFTFINPVDYDSTKVIAHCMKNNKDYIIEYGKCVNNQLPVSSKYIITEENKYGDKISYEAFYFVENFTKSTWEVTLNGTTKTVNIDKEVALNNIYNLEADHVVLKSISNIFDKDCIVTIVAPEVYTYELICNIEELKDVGLYKKGLYKIKFIDRIGNSYQLNLNLTGNSRYYDAVYSNNKSYTDAYNSIYNNNKTSEESEEFITDARKLKEAIDKEIVEDKYTHVSYQVYLNYLEKAKDVYSNALASQETIDKATKDLNDAIDSLVVSVDKTTLKKYIDDFTYLDKSLYTKVSYDKLKACYENALIIYNDDAATLEQVKKCEKEFLECNQALIFVGDKSSLLNKLTEIQKIDCSKYTPQTVEKLNDSYLKGVEIYNDLNSTQKDVDNILNLLNKDIKSLKIVADFSSLEKTIKEVQKINKTMYIKSSITNLEDKYKNAIIVYNDRNNEQFVVDRVTAELQLRIKNLLLRGNVDELINSLYDIQKIDYYLYDSKDIIELKEMYNQGLEIVLNGAKNDDILTLKNNIDNKLNIIQKSVNREKLNDLMTELRNMDISYMKDKELEQLIKEYNDAMNILLDYNSSDELILVKYNKLKTYTSVKTDVKSVPTERTLFENIFNIIMLLGTLFIIGKWRI